MGSLTTCIKKAGTALSDVDREAIRARAEDLRGTGLSAKAAAEQAVDEQIAAVEALIASAATPAATESKAPEPAAAPAAPQEAADEDMRGYAWALVKDGKVVRSGSLPSPEFAPASDDTKLSYYKAMADKAGADLHIGGYPGAAAWAPQEGLIFGMTWAELSARQQKGGRAGSAPEGKMPKDAVLAYSPAAPQEAQPAARPAAAQEAKPAKIEDFGQKLEGARKDYATTLKDAEAVDMAAEPLSKSWPEPDYDKLLAGGADKFVVAFIRAARDDVPTKPQKSWKLKGWVDGTKSLRETSRSLLAGEVSPDKAREIASKVGPAMRAVLARAELYQLVGHERSLKGITFAEHHYGLYKGQENVNKWIVEQKAKATMFSNWPRELAVGDTKAEMLENFKAKLSTLDTGAKAKGQAQFVIYRKRGQPGAFVGKNNGREHIDLHKAEDVTAARKYLQDNTADLEKALEAYKQTPFERKTDNQPRVGDDHRNGAPVTPEVFAETFGFRGVQFGNYVEQGRRQSDLNQAFDGLMDMAAVLGIPPRAISLNGKLGLAFGARGKGGNNAPAAHYEPGNVVINLTKGSGPGSLAHEWWHSLDNYFGKESGAGGYGTGGALGDKTRAEMKAAFDAVKQATQVKTLRKRSAELDKRKSKAYWDTPIELSARSFEMYVIAKLQDQGAANDYLANVVSKEFWDAQEALRAGMLTDATPSPTFPYPVGDELPAVRASFDDFFKTVQTRTDETGNVAMFSRAPTVRSALDKAIGAKEAFDAYDRKAVKVDDPENYFTLAQKLSNAKKALTSELVKQPDDAFALQGRNGSGRMVIVNGSAQNPGQWQITRFDGNDDPWGDSQYRTKESAIDDFLREIDLKSLRDIDGAFSRSGGRGISMRDAEAIKTRIREVLPNAPEIELLESVDKAPDDLQESIQIEGAVDDVEAVYWNGRIYAFPAHMASVERAAFVIGRHEVRHHGMRTRYGKKLDSILLDMHRKNPALRDAAAEIVKAGRAKQKESVKAIEEALADMPIDMIAKLSGYDRFIAAMRDWLRMIARKMRANGLPNIADAIDPKQLTDNDVAAFVLKAEKVSGAGSKGVAFSRAPATETPAFRKWFGDSQVVDAKGNPLVVYHGTRSDFSQFDPANVGARFPKQSAGFYFSSRPETASLYADSLNNAAEGFNPKSKFAKPAAEGANVIPVFAALKNPLVLTTTEFSAERMLDADGGKIVKDAKAAGHDGVIVRRNVGDEFDGTTVVAFRPEQIKSAIGNNGQFDGANPDIRYSRATTADAWRAAAGKVSDQNLVAGYKVGDLFESHGKLSIWDKTVGTPYNLARRFPDTFGVAYESVQKFLSDVSFVANEAANLAPKILPKLEHWRDIGKSPISAADTKAVSAPIFEGTLTWTRDKNGRPISMEKAEAEAEAMSTDDKAQELLKARRLHPNVLKMWQGLPVDQFDAAIETRYQNEMLRPGVVWSDAELSSMFKLNPAQIGLYHEFREATDKSLNDLAVSEMLQMGGKDTARMVDQARGMNAADASKALSDALYELADAEPDRAKSLNDTADKIILIGNRIADLTARGYAPLSRFGHHTLDVVQNGERVYFGMFESQAEANRMARQMRAQFPGATVVQGTQSQEAYKLFAGVNPDTLELFGEILGLDATGDSASDQAFQAYLKRAKATRSAMKRLIHRKGIAGFSEDMGRVLAGFLTSNARRTSSNLNSKAISAAVDDIPKHQGELKDYASRMAEYVRNPIEEAQAFRGLLFVQYLGGSVASALVNMTQPITVGFPYLSQFGGAKKAAKQLTAAFSDMAKRAKLEPALEKAIKQAEEEGTVAPQEIFQLMAQASGRGQLKSGDGTTAGDALAKANNGMAKLGLAWGKMFSFAELVNRRATYIAAFRLAVENGNADPAGFAKQSVVETQFTYNRGNKPVFSRGAIGATLFTFKTYSVSYLELMGRMWNSGPEARKAMLLGMAVLFLMSGADGLPGEEDLEDIIDGFMQRVMGRNFVSRQKRNEFLAAAVGEDLARFLEKGLSGLPGVPIDVSGRMGIGNVIPGTGLLRKDSADTGNAMKELAGPAGDLITRGFKAAGMALQGDLGKAAIESSPTAVRNVAKAYDMGQTGSYRDATGKKVIDTTAPEAVAKALGFQPNTVARVQAASNNVLRMIALNKINESEIADQWAQGIFERSPEKVQGARERMAEWNADNPESPIRINSSQIRKRVIAMNQDKATRMAKTAPKEIRATVKRELATP